MMPRPLVLASCAAALLLAKPSRAVERVETDASLGFALPAGSLERGSRVADTTYGAIPLRLDGAAFLAPSLALRASASFAVAIPKLCASAGDCASSLGHDVAVDLGARFAFHDVWRFAPRLDVGVGWEWYGSALSDHGVSSTRSYSGPTFVSLAIAMPIRFGDHFAIGPSSSVRAGTFTSATLTTPGATASRLDGAALHAWLGAAIDARLAF